MIIHPKSYHMRVGAVLLFCVFLCGQSVAQNNKSPRINITEAEVKQHIFSAGKGEAVHIDILDEKEPLEKVSEQVLHPEKGKSAVGTEELTPVRYRTERRRAVVHSHKRKNTRMNP